MGVRFVGGRRDRGRRFLLVSMSDGEGASGKRLRSWRVVSAPIMKTMMSRRVRMEAALVRQRATSRLAVCRWWRKMCELETTMWISLPCGILTDGSFAFCDVDSGSGWQIRYASESGGDVRSLAILNGIMMYKDGDE